MNISEFFPFWKELTSKQQQMLTDSARNREVKKEL